jgi:hypothetical protein
MTVPTKIQRLLDSRQLEMIEVPDADIVALWQKAVASARDAQREGLSPDNQYVLGYQALLQMATAILAAAGYRTRGAQGHHANTFYAVAALGIEGVEEIDVRTERIRQMRKLSAYEPGSPTFEQIRQLRELLGTSFPAARRWLTATRPSVQLAPLERG